MKKRIQGLDEFVNENKNETYNNFKKDFENSIEFADIYLDGNTIIIYLDTEPKKEEKIINKIVKSKYSNLMKKIESEDDVIQYIIK